MDDARYLATLEHEELLVRRGKRSGLFTMVAVHSTVRGPSLGGCRMWTYADARAAIRDVLRLSRAMTYKAACADLPMGGGKGVIMLPADRVATDELKRDALLDFADTVHVLEGRYVTAEDVGTSEEALELISTVTPHVSGLPVAKGGSGDPSPWTALGVHAAIKVACRQAFGSDDLSERSVSVVGLGHVGGDVARLCAADGARLVVSDINQARRAVADELGAEWLASPTAALLADVDVLSPNALGGVLDHDTIPLLRAKVVAGAANNQLADDDLAPTLAERGILWIPDFVASAGGIANISVELEPDGYDADRARARVLQIAETTERVILGEGTPLEAALDLARQRLSAPSA